MVTCLVDAGGEVCCHAAGSRDQHKENEKTFIDKVGTPAAPEKVIVTLISNGGQFYPAIVIGDFIRLTGLATYVPADKTCASACAFVWLAGSQRMVGGGSKAHIGFHGVFDAASGQQLVMPNVILATYLGYLNFNYEAVLWMLSPRPLAAHWLTAETTSQYGIFFEMLDPPRTVPLPPGAESPQQQPAERQPSASVSVWVVQDLHLRQQADPRAPDVLSPPPNNYIPRGSQVTVVGQCRLWSGRGAGDSENIWCPSTTGFGAGRTPTFSHSPMGGALPVWSIQKPKGAFLRLWHKLEHQLTCPAWSQCFPRPNPDHQMQRAKSGRI